MNEVENEILNLENKIRQDRKALDDFVRQCQAQGIGQDIINARIQKIRQEMSSMDSQLSMLQNELQKNNPANMQGQPVYSQVPPVSIQGQPVYGQVQPVNMQGQGQPVYGQVQPVNMQGQPVYRQAQPAERKNDLEKTFGKSWMGVIASGLVFISFIFFSVMLLPVLTNGMKMAGMFLVSFLFLGAGLVKLRVNRDNKFYLALCGCGLGAVYISILVSSIYFKAINDITLYLLVFVWAVCVCCLRRLGSVLFQLIGQGGITIAILFGYWVCLLYGNQVKFLMLAIFFAVTSIIFTLAHRQKNLAGNWVSLVFNFFNLCQLLLASFLMRDSALMRTVSMILLLYIALHFAFCYACEETKGGLDLGIATVVCMVMSALYLAILLRSVPSGGVIRNDALLLIGFISLMAAERKLGLDARAGRVIIQVSTMLLMFLAVLDMKVLDEHIYMAVLMIPFLCVGFLRRNWIFKYGSMIYLIVFLMNSQMMNPEKMLWSFAYFGTFAYFLRKEKVHYQSLFKLSAYCIFLMKIASDCVYIMHLFGADTYTSRILACIVTGAVNMVLSRSAWMRSNPVSGKTEQETDAVLYIVHVMEMLMGLALIVQPPAAYSNFVCIPWAVLLFSVNTKKTLLEGSEIMAGIYVGMKYTVLLLVILSSCGASKVLASVCFFALAVTCIICGFRVQKKSIRIYGLVLSMLSVFKLLLVDIAFGGLLHLAAGFFASGILCFVISRIYNSIDEKRSGL